MTRGHVLIDTDAGVDDALAILLALRSPEITVELITTVSGNVEVQRCTRNVTRVLADMHVDPSPGIVQGAARPLKLPLLTAPEVHGPGGLGTITGRRAPGKNNSNGAAKQIVDTARRLGKELTIVALGPLTNIATAVLMDHKVMRTVGRLISMGGAFRVPGNTGPVAEFNYFVDPHAVQTVIRSGMNILIVPLDVTQRVLLSWEQFCISIAGLAAQRRKWFHDLLDGYMTYHRDTEGRIGAYMHDPVAMAEAIRPGLLTSKKSGVEIEISPGPTRGMTSIVASPRSKVRVATDVYFPAWNRLSTRIWN